MLQTLFNALSVEEKQAEDAEAPPHSGEAAARKLSYGTVFSVPDRRVQHDAYLGNHAALLEYARKLYEQRLSSSKAGLPHFSTSDVIRFFRTNPKEMPESFSAREFGVGSDDLQVCHVVSRALGGSDWPYNYVLCTRAINVHFSKYMTREWESFVGKDAVQKAQEFAKMVATSAMQGGRMHQLSPTTAGVYDVVRSTTNVSARTTSLLSVLL